MVIAILYKVSFLTKFPHFTKVNSHIAILDLLYYLFVDGHVEDPGGYVDRIESE